MKAVVVDLQDQYAVILNKNGQFIKIRNNGQLVVGHEIDVPVKAGFNLKMFSKAASIAAAFLAVVGLSYGVYSYNTPYSYIDIDINPSVEITANRYNYIIHVEALNEDGQKIIGMSNYHHESIHSGIEKILKSAVDEGYIKTAADNAVMLTVSSKDEDKAVEVEKSVQDTAEAKIKEVNPDTRILVEKVTLQKREDARKQDVSPGKLVLIEKLKEEDKNIRVEDYKNAPVRDILKTIKGYRKEDPEDKKDKSQKEKEDKNDKKGDDRKDADKSPESPVKAQQPDVNKKEVEQSDRKKEQEKNDKEPESHGAKKDSGKQQSGVNTGNKDEKQKKSEDKAEDRPADKSKQDPRKSGNDRNEKNEKGEKDHKDDKDNKDSDRNDSKGQSGKNTKGNKKD